MDNQTLKFSQLRQILSELAFVESIVDKRFIAFRHEETDTSIFLPIYRSNQNVAPHHLVLFRVQLDAKGLMDADDFDRCISAAALKHPA